LPGVAEAIDWAESYAYLDQVKLAPMPVDETIGVLRKFQDAITKARIAAQSVWLASQFRPGWRRARIGRMMPGRQ